MTITEAKRYVGKLGKTNKIEVTVGGDPKLCVGRVVEVDGAQVTITGVDLGLGGGRWVCLCTGLPQVKVRQPKRRAPSNGAHPWRHYDE